jgi:N-acylneuraminate cytidylyltransferase
MATTTAARILGLVPARGGSKGIPGKNGRLLGGVPLLARAVRAGFDTGIVERVLLTTDSAELAAIGREAGAEVPFLRPPELARDDTPMLPVMQHAVRHVMAEGWIPDLILLLQPTAPFRRVEDIRAAVARLDSEPEADSIVSIEQIPAHFAPHFVMKVEEGRLMPFLPDGLRVTRRQDAPPAYTRNGQFYVTRTACLMEGNSIYGTRCLPFVTTHPAANLDTLEDWAEAEKLMGT